MSTKNSIKDVNRKVSAHDKFIILKVQELDLRKYEG